MRALVQRVTCASVSVNSQIVGAIDRGLLVLLGVGQNDTPGDAEALSRKVLRLRIFSDQQGKMNLSLLDLPGQLLVVSQFTLYGDTARGNRPSFSKAAPSNLARHLYDRFVIACRTEGIVVATGVFQADMQVSLVNDGPVTLLCDTEPPEK